MAAEKRKHEADDNPYESRRMRLRTTSARTKHQIKRQRTPNRKRPNPFFEHLPSDVRRVIYDYMELPPFKTAKMCAGLYLSYRQAKEEMNRAASARELENGSVPVVTTMDIDITICRTANDAREDEIKFQSHMHDIRDGLYCVKLGRVRIHMIDGMNGDLEQKFRESTNYWHCRRVIGSCLLWYPKVFRLRRIQALVVTWQAGDADSSEPIEWMEGRKYEKARGPSNSLCTYRFREQSGVAGALMVVIPQMDKYTAWGHRHLIDIYNDRTRSNGDVCVSKATLDYTNIEIGDGEVISERIGGST